MRVSLRLSLSLAALATGCLHTNDDFRAFRQTGNVWSLPTDEGTDTTWGALLVGYQNEFGSRLLVAGAATPGVSRLSVYGIVNGRGIPTAPEGPVMVGCGGNDIDPDLRALACGTGIRHVAPVRTVADRIGCVIAAIGATTASANERLGLYCESRALSVPRVGLDSLRVTSLVAASGDFIAQPSVFLGAAAVGDGRGAVFTIERSVLMRRTALEIAGLELDATSGLGQQLVAHAPPSGCDGVWLAGSIGPAYGPRRVFVARVESASSARVVGCLEGVAPVASPLLSGPSSPLAWGDFDGDGAVDLAVTSGSEVRVYAHDRLQAQTACSATSPVSAPTATLGCVPNDVPQIGCAGDLGFGHSLAAGNLDGRPGDELIIGAPLAEVNGRPAAGAVAVIASPLQTPSRVWVLPSIVRDDGHFGRAVAAPPSLDALGTLSRAELAVSQESPRTVRVHFCTGLAGDLATSEQAPFSCLPVDPTDAGPSATDAQPACGRDAG